MERSVPGKKLRKNHKESVNSSLKRKNGCKKRSQGLTPGPQDSACKPKWNMIYSLKKCILRTSYVSVSIILTDRSFRVESDPKFPILMMIVLPVRQ